jgi:hypothetical protein
MSNRVDSKIWQFSGGRSLETLPDVTPASELSRSPGAVSPAIVLLALTGELSRKSLVRRDSTVPDKRQSSRPVHQWSHGDEPMGAKSSLALLLLFPLLTTAQSTHPERQNVERAIHASISRAKEKDFALLYQVIAHDSAYLEVSPGKKITRGFSEFRKGEKVWRSPDFKAVGYEMRDLTINFSRAGHLRYLLCGKSKYRVEQTGDHRIDC